jgi:REP element-mobilizing transposase RayT
MTMHDGSVMTRRHLPHIENAGKTYMVTFATKGRFELALAARDIVLETVLHDHRLVYWLHAAVVMPEHVHFIATPLEQWRIAQALQRVKSVSAHRVNRLLNRHGSLWDQETYDRVVRAGENVRRACDYVIENPARRGLGAYRWIWREWVEGDGTGEGAYPPLED